MRQAIVECAVVVGMIVGLWNEPQVHGQDQPTGLAKELAMFEPLVGKTFRGQFANATPDKPLVDISSWERVLNGRAVRNLHSINDGQYGGETIIMWDEQQKKVTYWYFTTAGFFTKGTMEADAENKNRWTSLEEVTGNQNGITKVRATSTLAADGSLHVKSEYFANGNWTPGHEVTYKSEPGLKVTFK